MKKITFSILVFSFAIVGFSQNANDALRYSSISYGGTARFMSLSGAFGALGADFSCLSQNPAGIGFYRKSEFTISPGLFSSSTNSSYYGKENTDFRNNLVLGNLGMVFSLNLNEDNKERILKGMQFGFGMNRINNFTNRILVEGFNTDNSLLGLYADQANNGGNPLDAGNLDAFTGLLAYNANLMVYDSGSLNNPAHYWVDMPNGNVLQRKSIQMSGASREMLLSGGANFDNKLYLGISLGFPSIRYEEESNFWEQDSEGLSSNADPAFNFSSVARSENLTTKGNGFNLKFGFIYKPVDFIRIGAAFHTPTTYNLTDEWSAKMVSTFENGNKYTESSIPGSFDYRISTPMRAIGSIAFVLAKYGLISADYEYVDYSTARLRSDNYDFFDENDDVHSKLGHANNLRIGAEFRQNIFAFRAGTSYYGSPYLNESTRGARMGYSLGLGLRDKTYFLDFAFNHTLSKDDLYLYETAVAKNTYMTNSFMVTLGFRY
jgi:hypothetical protein